MFAALLRDREGWFADNYPHLGFGKLLDADLDVGIDDTLWSKEDKRKPAEQPVEEIQELTDAEKTGDLTLWDEPEDEGGA